ncbi:polysaccharide deacetylase family protein [Natrinema halophilum]|uniref:Polysaccharide deacetylase family protein n=1 Tax=Natrinema halophilum TaxID=1699371 RepID=A0A7D5KIP6_9EURY|nr:polysaccharide deacetylase family protein [Natrinema halophilum]QLG48759.1 polysaccharide deacetylase family protein [Natrinema halophilum]
MKRRTYLSAAFATALAGCSSSEESDGEGPDAEQRSNENGTAVAFDDFENLDAWDAPLGTLSADESRTYTGSQSAKLESGSDNQFRIVRELSEPADLSGMRPCLAVSTEHEADMVVQLLDEDENRMVFRQQVHRGTPLVQTNFGVDTVDGEPDMSAISEVQLLRWTGDDDKGAVWVDDLRFVSTPDVGKVMLQFDGGYETDYTHALPVLQEYDYPAVSFITPGRVREDERATGDHLLREQLDELADAGWTIASHSMHGLDLTSLSDRDPESEIRDATEWLEDEGFEDGAQYFAYPQGMYNGDTLEFVAEHHDLAFAGLYPSQGFATNPHLCSRVDGPDAGTAQSMLDLTAEVGGITSLAFGQLDDGSRSALAETIGHLNELESAGDLEVIGPSEMAESFVR